MSQLDVKIGPKIKSFRRQLGLQANKLAEQLGISPSYLNLIESGKRKIDGDLLIKVCEELKIELSDLTNKSDLNLVNDISELLDDQLFEDLDILGPEVQDLVNTNPKIARAILKPFFLKKLITGPITVPVIHATVFVPKLEEPNFFSIILSVRACDVFLSVGCGSCTNIKPMLQAIITIPKIKKVICQ